MASAYFRRARENRATRPMPVTVEIKGDRLTYKTAPFVSPFIGKQMVAMLVWERII